MAQLLGAISALTITSQATAAISSLQFVGFDGAPAGDGDAVLGVARTDAGIGDNVAVDVIAVLDLIAGAAIPLGSAIQSNADGAPIAKAAGVQIGTAITAAANPGDIVKILIK